MLGYIKKFVLDSFPSIIATIIGAYIVHHYVIPAAAPKAPASAMASDPSPATQGSAIPAEKASFEKAVAEKSAIEKTAEKATEKSSEPPVETKRRHVAPRVASRGNVAPEATGSIESGTGEERRDANELARAAIERLRNAPGAARTVAPVPAATTHNADEASRTIPPMQPLPPAANVTKGPEVFVGGTEAAVPSPAQHPDYGLPLRAAKLTPPANIPEANPIELHAEAQATSKPSITEDVMSAAKSVFHAVVPR